MTTELGSPIDIVQPKRGLVPVVLSSPHSGQVYPPSLMRGVRLTLAQLRRLEDAFVDQLFEAGPHLGAPLVHAHFARAFVDANREAYELDEDLFDEPLPVHANLDSAKAKAGLGTIPSRVGGQPIYRSKLSLGEAERRISQAYWPYHHALQHLLDDGHARFGQVLLLDCHSMPSFNANGVLAGGPIARGANGGGMIDFALGDRFGNSCAPSIVQEAEAFLRMKGFRVARNRPYAGGHITAHYGQPASGVHALQIEVRRGLYMNETTMRLEKSSTEIKAVIQELLAWMITLMKDAVRPRRREAATALDRP